MSLPISGFTAIPNPQMLAFMAAQSFVMMYQAGEGWQYGKRKISAMSNEDFNKLTPQIILQNQAASLRGSLPTIVKSMNDMTPIIRDIVRQYGDFAKAIINELPAVAKILLEPPATGGFPGQGDRAIMDALTQGFQKMLNIRGGPTSGPTIEAFAELQKQIEKLIITKHNLPPVVGPPSPFPSKTGRDYDIPATPTGPTSGGYFSGPAPISKPSDIPFQPGQTSSLQRQINALVSKISERKRNINRDILLIGKGGSVPDYIIRQRILVNKGYVTNWESQLVKLRVKRDLGYIRR